MELIYGKKITEKIYAELETKIVKLKEKNIVPKIATVLVGDNPASVIYVNKKVEMAKKIGLEAEIIHLSKESKTEDVKQVIEKICADKNVNGVLVQLPLPAQIDTPKVLRAICPEKDVDGFHAYNLGKLVMGFEDLPPATPAGIIDLLDSENVDLKGKNVVVVGASIVVGKPLSIMLMNREATVTICNDKTKNLAQITNQADVLISATGAAKLITENYVKKDAFVIDVGFARDENGKLCGDVNSENIKNQAKYLTPVPGGVGPITIATLLKNLVHATERQHDLAENYKCVIEK